MLMTWIVLLVFTKSYSASRRCMAMTACAPIASLDAASCCYSSAAHRIASHNCLLARSARTTAMDRYISLSRFPRMTLLFGNSIWLCTESRSRVAFTGRAAAPAFISATRTTIFSSSPRLECGRFTEPRRQRQHGSNGHFSRFRTHASVIEDQPEANGNYGAADQFHAEYIFIGRFARRDE